jgi:hypothetical protein
MRHFAGMSFRRSLFPLSVLLSLSVAGHCQSKTEQLLTQGSFEFPPVSKRVPLDKTRKGDPTVQPIDPEWRVFKDSGESPEGKVTVGLTNEQHYGVAGRGQALFVQFDKVTKKRAAAVLATDLISIQPGKPYHINIYGRVDKTDPVALDTRLPYLRLRVDWFKRVKASAPDEEDAKNDDDEKPVAAPGEAPKAGAEAPKDVKAAPAETVKPGAESPKEVKDAPTKKAGETAAPGDGKKSGDAKKAGDAAKPAEAKKGEEAEEDTDDDYEWRQAGVPQWRFQPLPGSKPVPGAKPRKPLFSAGKWSEYFVDLKAPDDAQFIKVSWSWETGDEEGETNGVMYFDNAGIEGVPGPKEDIYKDNPELKKIVEDAENDPDAVRPDPIPGNGKPIEAVPITPVKPAEPAPAPVKK